MPSPAAQQPHSPQTRRQRNRAEMHAAILDASRTVMRTEGVPALNLNQVAAHIGIKTPSLYEYFDGKPAIYDTLFRLGFELFAERMNHLLEHAKTWQDAMRGGIETYMQFALDYPELFQLCFEHPVPGFVPSQESIQASWTLLQAGREHLAKMMQQDGVDFGMTPVQANDLLIAIMHGLTAQHLANEPHLPIGQGRFGSLIPVVIHLFEAASRKPAQPAAQTSAPHQPTRLKENQK